MAHPNDDRLRKGYEAFAKADMDTINELFHDDIVWHVPGDNSISGSYKGKDEVLSLFGRMFQETAGSLKFELIDTFANDKRSVAYFEASGERNGMRLEGRRGTAIYEADANGKVRDARTFPEDSKAFDEFWS